MINFTGKLISSPTIQTTNAKGQVRHNKLSLYQLDPNSYKDNRVLETLVDHWAEQDTFVREIENNFKYNKYYGLGDSEEQFFILTKKLREGVSPYSEDVLAVAQTSIGKTNPNSIEIDYLQVMPKSLRAKERVSMQQLGSAILDELKNIFYGKDLWCFSTRRAVDFYEKNGFKQIGTSKVGLPIMKF